MFPIALYRFDLNGVANFEQGALVSLPAELSNNRQIASYARRNGRQISATRIDNVIAIQTLLSLRVDSLDFASNPTLLTLSTVPVFRRVDKVIRIFRATGNAKRLNIEFHGVSYGSIRGPNVFELVPFAILDNSIKYSPAGQKISVAFSETPERVRVDFLSIGPKIEADEMDKIFEKKYRGKNAVYFVRRSMMSSPLP